MSGQAELRAGLERMGLLRPGEPFTVHALAGGVSSDIRMVETPSRRFCVKRALARLKVAAVWEVPVSRSLSEVAWLRVADGLSPGLTPKVLGQDPTIGFAMEYLEPARHPVWKSEMLAGRVDPAFAGSLGARMGKLHAAAAGERALAAEFANDALFEALRLEPYLRATAKAHPPFAETLTALADRTAATKRTLVHGDLSPKNILVGPAGPVVLDAECAWYGDPAFDLAFCLNHLLLKSVHLPENREALLAGFDRLGESYLAEVGWEPPKELEMRAATLLPGLLLARVDGKSPVEYLDEASRGVVRQRACALLADLPLTLSALREKF